MGVLCAFAPEGADKDLSSEYLMSLQMCALLTKSGIVLCLFFPCAILPSRAGKMDCKVQREPTAV